jgi:peptide/nickel transport system substrate-binding protein
MTFTANPNYWEEGKPCVDTLIYKVIPEESTRVVALEAGEVDVVYGVGPADVKRLKENPNIKIDEQVISRSVYMGFLYDQEPFNDMRVRQALWHAVDADSIVEFAQEGFGEKATTFYPSFIFGSAEG